MNKKSITADESFHSRDSCITLM